MSEESTTGRNEELKVKKENFWFHHATFCDEDCNHCEAANNRQVSVILNALREVFGKGVYRVVQHYCPNLTCCADCRIDDFCHFEGCEIVDEAERCAEAMSGGSEAADSTTEFGHSPLPWRVENGKIVDAMGFTVAVAVGLPVEVAQANERFIVEAVKGMMKMGRTAAARLNNDRKGFAR